VAKHGEFVIVVPTSESTNSVGGEEALFKKRGAARRSGRFIHHGNNCQNDDSHKNRKEKK
jgi:hypothetical protein